MTDADASDDGGILQSDAAKRALIGGIAGGAGGLASVVGGGGLERYAVAVFVGLVVAIALWLLFY